MGITTRPASATEGRCRPPRAWARGLRGCVTAGLVGRAGLAGLTAMAALAATAAAAAATATATATAGHVAAAPAAQADRVLLACRQPAAATAPAAWQPAPGAVSTGPAAPVTVLQRDGLTVQWQGDFLLAYSTRAQHDDAVALKQPDYGHIRHVWPDRAQGLLALGDQVSYRVAVGLQAGQARLGPVQRQAALTASPCAWWHRLVGRCQPARAIYSAELQALLIGGVDDRGRAQLLALGLPPDGGERPLLKAADEAWAYAGETPGTGGVLLRSARGALVFFDGERAHPCPP